MLAGNSAMMAFVNIVDSITMGSIVRSITQVLPRSMTAH